MLGKDGVAALVILVASAALFALTLDLKPSPFVPVGPGFYPRIVLGFTGALAVLLLVMDVLARRARAAARPKRANHALVWSLFGVFGAYVVALPYVGFRLSTFVFAIVSQLLLDPRFGARRLAIVLVVAAVTTGVTYLVFERYLDVLLPRGRWTGF